MTDTVSARVHTGDVSSARSTTAPPRACWPVRACPATTQRSTRWRACRARRVVRTRRALRRRARPVSRPCARASRRRCTRARCNRPSPAPPACALVAVPSLWRRTPARGRTSALTRRRHAVRCTNATASTAGARRSCNALLRDAYCRCTCRATTMTMMMMTRIAPTRTAASRCRASSLVRAASRSSAGAAVASLPLATWPTTTTPRPPLPTTAATSLSIIAGQLASCVCFSLSLSLSQPLSSTSLDWRASRCLLQAFLNQHRTLNLPVSINVGFI